MSAFWSMFWFKPFRNFLRKFTIFRNFDQWSEILSMSDGRPLSQGVCPSLGPLSWLTNSALVYDTKCGGEGSGVSANEYSCAHGRSPNKLWRSNSIFNPAGLRSSAETNVGYNCFRHREIFKLCCRTTINWGIGLIPESSLG
jgi:hypothetical protein